MSRRSATSANSVKATASHHHENNMIIAKAKRKENIAEYLLYMWQVEDIIRAYGLDIEKINANIVQRYDTDDKTRHEITEWYEGLIKMIELENKRQNGHLQININTLIRLVKLLDDHRAEKYDNSRKIWTVFIFLQWYDVYFGENV